MAALHESQVTGTLPGFASSFSCRAIAALLELQHDVIRDGVALPPSETVSYDAKLFAFLLSPKLECG